MSILTMDYMVLDASRFLFLLKYAVVLSFETEAAPENIFPKLSYTTFSACNNSTMTKRTLHLTFHSQKQHKTKQTAHLLKLIPSN